MTKMIRPYSPIWPTFARRIVSNHDLEQCDAAMAESLPPSLRETLKSFVSARRHNTTGCPLLGEALPWIIRDLNGLDSDEHFIKRCTAWLQIYYSVMITDDYVDLGPLHNADSSRLWLTSHLLLQQGVGQVIATARSPQLMQDRINKALTDCAMATAKELDLRCFANQPPELMSLQTVGKKFAVARICADMFRQAEDICLHNNEDFFWDDLSTGLQLLDDLTDLEGDWKSKNITRPVSRIFTSGMMSEQSSEGVEYAESLLITSIVTGALQELLSDINNALNKCLASREMLFPNSRHDFWSALTSLAGCIQEALDCCHIIGIGAQIDGPTDHRQYTKRHLDAVEELRSLIGTMTMYS